MKKKTKLLILIPLGAVLLNGLGYLIALNLRAPAKSDGAGTASAAGERSSEGILGEAAGAAAAGRLKEDRVKEEKAMARRAAGMAALEAGDYERALADFAEARALAGDRAYVSELLRVTEDLAHRPPAARRPVVLRSALPPPRVAGRFRTVERAAPREAPPPVEAPLAAPPAAPVPSSGLLLVSTTPRGLLVHVDDVPVDLTPTRASLKVGPHRVSLFDGDRKVFETNVEVKSGSPTTLARDLSSEIAPASRPVVAAVPFAKDEGSEAAPPLVRPATRATVPAASRAPGSVMMARAAARKPAPLIVPSTGGLEVTSPGLYGEIWINGRSWGFPPVRAGDLPPGPTRVGIRVNGVEERSAIVAVKPGQTTSVRLSRQETPAN